MDWRQVNVLYRREMRAALRERSIVINSILMPIFLYPLLLWVAFTGLTFIEGQSEGSRSRVAARHWPADHPGLRRRCERDPRLEVVESLIPLRKLERMVQSGDIDALLEFLPAPPDAQILSNNFQARITLDESKENSVAARDRLRLMLDRYRRDWLQREAHSRGVPPREWQGFVLSSRNVASKKQMGAFALGLLLPVIFVVMVAAGCFYPAVDAVAGERERSTWETLMSTAANRVSILTAKYLYVATLGGLAGLLNVLAVLLTFKPILAPLFEKAGATLETSLPLMALPVLAMAGILLAGFVAAGMMIFAAFARSFREGQAMLTPFYLLILVPAVFLQVPGLTLSLPLALLPVLNLTLMIREALAGTFNWPAIALTLVVEIVLIAACARLATYILQFEDIVMGSYSGSFASFLKARVLKRPKLQHRLPRAAA